MKNTNQFLLAITLLSTALIAQAQNSKAEADEKQAQGAFYTLGYDVAPEQWLDVVKMDIDYRINHSVTYQEDLEKFKLPSTSQKKIIYDEKLICSINPKSKRCLVIAKENQKKLHELFAKLGNTNAQLDILLAQTLHPNIDSSIIFTHPIPQNLLQISFINSNYFKPLTNLLLTRNALTYLDDKDKAILKTCQSIALGRGLIGNNSGYLKSIIGAHVVKQHSRLLNDMLVDSKKTLPKACYALLKPLLAEKTTLCHDKVQTELTVKIALLIPKNAKVLFYRPADSALFQKEYDRFCNKEQLNAVKKDMSVPPLKSLS